jgi:hypothetical protein
MHMAVLIRCMYWQITTSCKVMKHSRCGSTRSCEDLFETLRVLVPQVAKQHETATSDALHTACNAELYSALQLKRNCLLPAS